MEADPNGIGAHEKGAKLDAGKPRVALMISGFASALLEVSKVTTFGARKYSPNGWATVPNGIERYLDALCRHLLADLRGEVTDCDSSLPHMAQVAWNALAVLELRNRKADEAIARETG